MLFPISWRQLMLSFHVLLFRFVYCASHESCEGHLSYIVFFLNLDCFSQYRFTGHFDGSNIFAVKCSPEFETPKSILEMLPTVPYLRVPINQRYIPILNCYRKIWHHALYTRLSVFCALVKQLFKRDKHLSLQGM